MMPFKDPRENAEKKLAELEKSPSAPAVVPKPKPFTYVDETSIEDELKCPICLDPLYEPVSHASCGNMFCAQCIKPLKTCPMCRADVADKDIQGVARYITNKLSGLKITCTLCNGPSLQRGDLPSHQTKCKPPQPASSSSSSGASCPGADVACPFSGSGSELDAHVAACPYAVMRPLIKNLEAQLQTQKKANEAHIAEIAKLTAAQEATKQSFNDELQAVAKQLAQRIDKVAADAEHHIKHLQDHIGQQSKQVDLQLEHLTKLTADMQGVEKNLQEQIQAQANQLMQTITENERLMAKLSSTPRPASAQAAPASSSSGSPSPSHVTIVQGSNIDAASLVNANIQNFDTLAQRILLQSQQIQMIVQDLERTKSVVQQQFQVSGHQFEQLYLDYENTKKVLQAYTQIQNQSIEKVATSVAKKQ